MSNSNSNAMSLFSVVRHGLQVLLVSMSGSHVTAMLASPKELGTFSFSSVFWQSERHVGVDCSLNVL